MSVENRKVLEDVSTYGWHVVKVSRSGEQPGWAFSIGLHQSFRHPELLMFGLDLDLSQQLINDLAKDVRGGRRFGDGDETADLIAGYRCTFRMVDRVWYSYVLGYAAWFYRGHGFPALQCFWPDSAQRYPWEPGFDPRLLAHQPLLFDRDPTEARALGLLESMTHGSDEPESGE